MVKIAVLGAHVLIFLMAATAWADESTRDDPPKPPAFRIPKGWQKVDAAPLASARFQIKEKDQKATVAVTALPGENTHLAPNINRWRGQLGLPVLSEKEALKNAHPIKVDGSPGHRIDMTSPDTADREKQRILVVIVPRGKQTWYFRLMGPARLVGNQVSAFDDFIRSVHFEK